jgi:alpha-amylase
MTPPQIRLVLALHNHQPVGNFDGVFEAAYHDSYAPFLDVLEQYPEIPVSLHTSGSLLDWIAERHPEYIDRLRGFVERGQIEIIGGPYFEPILACIPGRDRVGQIRAYSQHLERTFGGRVRGMWVPERVWEQSFTADITAAGIEYTIVDDFHFKGAGLAADRLYGYYFTEDEGRLLKIFPGSERLRYTIPFQDPQETINYLRGIAERFPNSVVAFGDDGEKFGTWPGTKDHVYRDGWLRRFLDALMANRDWLKVATLAEAVDCVAPLGRVYLPDSSYREMTEWALPTEQQILYHDLVHRKEHDPDWPQLKQFVRGGFWRNFLTKYAESNEMYCRMREVSDRLDELSGTPAARERPDLLNQARMELYRGQCNCPYWHGAFGGLYLPHLRNAIYRHLIAADNLLEELSGRTGRWVHVDVRDYNLDARKEVRLASNALVAYLAPARGGHLYELDVRSIRHNLLATLNRRPEAYHQKVLRGEQTQEGQAVSIHDLVKFKQPDLDKKLCYDQWPRKMLVDHWLRPGVSAEEFQRGEGEIGDFVKGVYDARLRQSSRRVEAILSREGRCGEHRVRITKTIALDVASGSLLEIQYELSQLPPGASCRFAVEFNFAGLAAGADDRYFYNGGGQQLGRLESVLSLDSADRIGLVDEWLGIDTALDLSQPARVWTFPIQTVSTSESGFELVHQSSVVVPHWEFTPDESGSWSVRIQLSADTSLAQARRLAEARVGV